MKKIFTALLFLMLSLSSFAEIASGTCGPKLTWSLSNDYILTIDGEGDMYNYLNSDEIPWYPYHEKILALSIGKKITSIGKEAFKFCSSLTSVTIPNSVTSIGQGAFKDCSSLTSVTIPNSVTSIESGAFQYCSRLTSVTIPNSVTSIGAWTFYYCSRLTSVTIPNSVTSIGVWAFKSCSSLTSVTIPSSVTSIEEGAFEYCSSLTNLYILGTVNISENYYTKFPIEELFISKGVTESSLSYLLLQSMKKLYVEWKYPYAYKSTWKINPGQTVLYVPKGTADHYWAEQGWRNFRDIIEYDVEAFKKSLENGGNPNDGVSLTINDGSNGSIVAMLEPDKSYTFAFNADDDWMVSYVTFNNADVTSSLNNNVFTTPVLTANSTLSVVYTTADAVKGIRRSNVKVLNVDGGLDVSNAAAGQTIDVFNTDGKRIASAVSNGLPQHIDINESGVVIIKIGNETFKTAVK